MDHEPQDAIEEMLAAYALNALDEDERAVVERALEREPRYAELLRDYLDGAAVLAQGFGSAAPEVASPSEHRTAGVELAIATPRPWSNRALAGLAAMLVVSFLGFGLMFAMQQGRIGDLEAEMAEAEETMQDQRTLAYFTTLPNVETAVMKPVATPASFANDKSVGPRAMLMVDPDTSLAILVALDMEPLPPNRIYRAWARDRLGTPMQLVSFAVDDSGFAQVYMDVPEDMDSATSVGVSSSSMEGSGSDEPVLSGDIE